MVAEAERFVLISGTLVHGWEGTAQITDWQAKYVVVWGRMSYALLMWQKTSLWQDKDHQLSDKGIYGPDEASHTQGLLLWPTRLQHDFL